MKLYNLLFKICSESENLATHVRRMGVPNVFYLYEHKTKCNMYTNKAGGTY